MLLTDVETSLISAFPFSYLFNFKKEAISMLGYKHSTFNIKKKQFKKWNQDL